MYEEDFKPPHIWLYDKNDEVHPDECHALNPLSILIDEEEEYLENYITDLKPN